MFPYSIIRRLMKNKNYIMAYFHPRDFDQDQPIINGLSLVRKFKSYYGLKNSFSKLNKFLEDYKFIDLLKADEQVNWENTPIVKL